ncbi:MAG: hypothetical protein M0P71_12855 [Melioribacteraceae bacterium]|jgi:hypothetical protein|nr:hypothetical protein [Melioribacteraceae bacterium]
MKYTIEGLQQSKLLEWKLDSADAVIIRFLIDFFHTEKMKKLEVNGARYFWVHYKTILEEIPILNIAKAALANRFKKYVDCNLMDFYLEKSAQGTYTYYRFIEKSYSQLIKENTDPLKVKIDPPTQSQLRTKDYSTKSISKDIDKSFKKTQTFKTSIYLELWNSLKEKYSMLQQHNNPEKKVYQKAASMIQHLKNGTFGDHYHINPEFMKKNHIRFSLLEKQFTKQEIKICIERLPKLFIEGYWPPDKKWLPKDLPTLIYNSRTNTSWLLHVFTHPPRPMNQEKTEEQGDNERAYKNRGKMSEEEFHNIPGIKETDEFMEKFG